MYKYLIRPLEHGLAAQYPSVGIPGTFAPATSNVKALRHSIRKRWGYTLDRTFPAGTLIDRVFLYQEQDGTRHTLILTGTDVCRRETAAGKTYSYLTPTYTAGTITGIADTVTVTGSGTLWTDNASAGDQFIINADHTSDEEPDPYWATILEVKSNTELLLSAPYTGAATSGAYKIRKLYSLPEGEKWGVCSVGKASGNYFIATNGATNVQYWDGSTGTMQEIDALYAGKSRFCRCFGDRLVLADKDDEINGSVRNPFLLGWSTISNPLDFDYSDDSSAGRKNFSDTGDYIVGLGVAGPSLVVFKRDGFYVGYNTEDATAPYAFPSYRPGLGCRASNSIVEAMGTVFWLGENDFYRLDGDQATAMGENAIYKVYDVINETEAQNVWGFADHLGHEIIWIAPSSTGAVQYLFSWDYKYNEWNMYETADFITSGGVGAI